ncbi:MAG: hypothetical protein QMD85_01110, partial [Candidatus Aenigmarchaeota archaeon]|nr:hypothetical protein [Candidatus Aenigmarchaeota archaeon]MDI6722137.1 hypothetical protein [Candidatus Aenigmarchaeota archaeon]
MIKVYAFDFDGVLTSNTDELFVLCKRAWQKMRNDTENINEEDIKKLRPMIKNFMDLYALMYLLENKKDVTPEAIRNIRQCNLDKSEEFSEIFFTSRYEMHEKDFHGWLKLYKPFAFVIDALKELMERHAVYIVSSKDKKTILLLLEQYSIGMDESRVLAKEMSLHKGDLISHIRKT